MTGMLKGSGLDLNSILDSEEKDARVSSISLKMSIDPSNFLSTSSLVLDLILGGGLPNGRLITLSGKESVGKSTMLYGGIGEAIPRGIAVLIFDYEGSLDPDYFSRIVKLDPMEVFGDRDDRTGEWSVEPKVRYYRPENGEDGLILMQKVLGKMPSKVCVNNTWYYIYESNKQNLATLKGQYNKRLRTSTNQLYVPVPDNRVGPELLIGIDSYPAMTPRQVVDKGEDTSMATQARMFGKYVLNVRSLAAQKGAIIYGINQVREKPLSFGDPVYEPGGNALMFSCFAEDTYIFTDKGMLPAKRAFRQEFDKVVGLEGEEVYRRYAPMGLSPISKLTLDNGYFVEGKPNHKVLALPFGYSKPKWVKLEDIKNNDSVAVKVGSNLWASEDLPLSYSYSIKETNNNELVKPTIPTKMTKKLARLLGYIIGNKDRLDSKMKFVSVNSTIVDDFLTLFDEIFDVPVSTMEHKGVTIINFHSNILEGFFDYLGVGDKTGNIREIPWCILQSKKSHIVEFLKTYFVLEGITKIQQCGFCSSSKLLMHQIHLLLLNFGIVSKLTLDEYSSVIAYKTNSDLLLNLLDLDKKAITKMETTFPDLFSWKERLKDKSSKLRDFCLNYYKVSDSSRLTSSMFKKDFVREATSEIQQLEEQLQNRNLKKLNELKALATLTRKQNLEWFRVDTIQHNLEPKMTYDCNMPTTHSVVTNGIVSHNSDIRVRFKSIAPPSTGKGKVEVEGKDEYVYLHMKTIKNKAFLPFREGTIRLWIGHKGEKGFGPDPVFDAFEFLKMTNQVKEDKGKLTILIPKHEQELDWKAFKKNILTEKDKKQNIRELCKKQMKKGKGIELYIGKKNEEPASVVKTPKSKKEK